MNLKIKIDERSKTVRFKGKVSWWFYAIIIGVTVLLMPIIVMACVDTNIAVLMINLFVLISVELFCIPITLHNFVELQNEALLIVFGFIKKTIPYSDIAALSATNNPMSSLGASFDRIEIKCGNKPVVMISIVDKEGFFHEMNRRNTHINFL